MEHLTRELVESHLLSFIDVFKDGERWDWNLSPMADGVQPPDHPESARFLTRDGATQNAIEWIGKHAPQLERAAAQEAREGIKYRATQRHA